MSDLLTPVADAETPPLPLCAHCEHPFDPRKSSGGQPQRFCAPECRAAFHAQRSQRGPTCTQSESVSAVIPPPEKSPPAATADDFDWTTGADSVLVPEQQAIAAYWNTSGNLVIRQERSWCDDEDSFIVVHSGNVHALIEKLCDVAGIPSMGR